MIRFDQNLCVGCGACIRDCVSYCITLENGKAQLKDPTKNCIHCGHCAAVCPVGAVQLEAERCDMSDVELCDPALPGIDIDSLLHSLKFRRSIRQYEKRPVPRAALEKILQAARYSATGGNHQSFTITVVQDRMEEFHKLAWEKFSKTIEQRMADPNYQPPGIIQRALLPKNDPMQDTLFWGAPCLIVTASEGNSVWDAGMASQSMELAAVSQGLGALYSGYLVGVINGSEALKDWLGLGGKTVKTCVLFGYPAVSYRTSAPKKESDLIWR